MKRALVTLLAVAALAGCGSSSAAPPSPPQTSTPAAGTTSASPSPSPVASQPAAVASLTVEDAIAKTGCTGYKLAAEAAPFAATYGTCRWKGNRLQLYSFDDEASREKFLDLSAQYGAPRSSVVIAGLLVAALDRQTDRALLRTTLLG
jgi:hypothetical protein